MVTVLATPASGRIILDANNTVIKIQSTNGDGYYFRAKIYVDGILFDEQGWSRSDNHTAAKDLKGMLFYYFNPAFAGGIFANGISEQTDLKKLVSITIEEYNLISGTVVDTVELPSFYVIYSVKPFGFNDTTKLMWLGVDTDQIVMPAVGAIRLPFYASSVATGITPPNLIVEIKTNSGTVLATYTVNAFAGKKVYLLRHQTLSLSYNVLYLIVTIKLGTATITKNIRINRLPNYPIKEIVYQNNFGYYLSAYLDGELETVDNYDRQSYETRTGDEKIYQIDQDVIYTINSGSFTDKEKAVMNMISNSLDCYFKGDRGVSGYYPVVPQTKKVTSFKDRQHQFDTDLTFKYNKGQEVANTGMIVIAAPQRDIEITGIIADGRDIDISYVFHNGFEPQPLLFQFRQPTTLTWINLPIAVPVSPSHGRLGFGTWVCRIAQYSNLNNVSNEVTIIIT